MLLLVSPRGARLASALIVLFVWLPSIGHSESNAGSDQAATSRPVRAPDVRTDDTKLKLQKGDFVAVPIPISNPTFDTGLVAVAAYFYPQTKEQEAAQPASVTGVAGMYTSNDSYAYAIAQQNYWDSDTWRFTGAAGHSDLKLKLLAPAGSGAEGDIDWLVTGNFAQTTLSRRIYGNWYGGVQGRYVDMKQTLGLVPPENRFDSSQKTKAVGVGASVEYDSRDLPLNTYQGRYFQLSALFNEEDIGSDRTYQSYNVAYRSYHELADDLVLAWELEGCKKSGMAPLWDACRLGLRGFSSTDYVAESSFAGQVEVRWRFHGKWGLVGFAGAGTVTDAFSDTREKDTIPSYGVGLRYSVLPAKRINLRLDYARSKDSDGIEISVGEAF